MNKEKLKNLVKQYFNLTEVKEEEVVTAKFETITLEDGTEITNGVETPMAVGDIVTSADGEGNQVPVTVLEVELPDGRTVMLDGMGMITEIQEVESELPAEEAPAQEAMSEVDAKQIISAIAEMVNGKFAELETKLTNMETKVETFSKAPATTKTVVNKFSKPEEVVTDKRYALAMSKIKTKN
jgi:hypothetical protein